MSSWRQQTPAVFSVLVGSPPNPRRRADGPCRPHTPCVQTDIEDVEHRFSGDAVMTYVDRDKLLTSNVLGPVWTLPGYAQYTRLPRGVVEAVASGPVLGEAEEAALARVKEMAKVVGRLASKGDGEATTVFEDVPFDEQGPCVCFLVWRGEVPRRV